LFGRPVFVLEHPLRLFLFGKDSPFIAVRHQSPTGEKRESGPVLSDPLATSSAFDVTLVTPFSSGDTRLLTLSENLGIRLSDQPAQSRQEDTKRLA